MAYQNISDSNENYTCYNFQTLLIFPEISEPCSELRCYCVNKFVIYRNRLKLLM